MTPRRHRFSAWCALGALLLSACGATAEGGDTTSVSTVGVIDIGALPAPLPSTTSTVPATSAVETTTTLVTTTTMFESRGNRILMIGDSILASTSKRYSNDMCAALVPMGWEVEIAAEVSRGIDFGVDVMRVRGDAGWDAALVFLGTNYGNDEEDYLRQLNRLIGEFGDIPVVLVTVSEYRDELREVNRVIGGLAELYDNVSIVDWREITATFPTLLNDDGIHPTRQGREVLAESVALHLGEAPAGPGRCLDSSFTDDSAGSIDGGTGTGAGSGGGQISPTTTVRQGTPTTAPTTTKPGTTTTVAGGGSSPTTTSPSSSSPTTTSPSGTSPTTTSPASGTTAPATTAPVTTAPVTTAPVTTAAAPPPGP